MKEMCWGFFNANRLTTLGGELIQNGCEKYLIDTFGWFLCMRSKALKALDERFARDLKVREIRAVEENVDRFFKIFRSLVRQIAG
nr:hypothetical protein [Rhodopirellula baltica]